MDYVNTKRSALFLNATDTLPVLPADFIELNSEFVVNPNPTVTEFNRVSSLLGGTDSYADTCHVTLSQSIEHMMRSNNKAADALDTPPELANLLKVCGFDETIDAGISVKYTPSQSPVRGSAILNVDGKQFSSTDNVVGNCTFNFAIGTPAKISADLNGFLDNEGIPTDNPPPVVNTSEEDLLMMSCTDIILADGTAVSADSITIEMGAEIGEKYALGLKQFDMTDYVIKFTANFFVDSANYADAQTKLINQDIDTISIKLNTDTDGNMVDGKSLLIEAGKAKVSTYEDTAVDSTVKRSQTWLLRPDGTTGNIVFTYGTFA